MLVGNTWCFVHVPRTSGMSMRRFLKSNTACDELGDFHSKVSEVDLNPSLYTFGFVRNPYSREYSLYTIAKAHRIHAVTFDEWINAKFVDRTTTPHIFTTIEHQKDYFNDTCNIFRYENRHEALHEISNNIGVNPVDFQNYTLYRNSYRYNTDYRQMYTNSTYDVVSEHLKEDIEFFGYTFDNVQ